MDFVNKLTGGDHNKQSQSGQASHGGGLMDKVNNAFGGGQSGEQKEDGLDKAVDYVQEHFLHQGAQNNESAVEQAKDEQISDAIRSGFKKATGHDFPIKDKS
ncbi:hypothetical protein DL96DRAFT_1708736 [Flagelloscypha sp. PMI_526]|nr:hypothetical protein DL96DRAFT_1708736 [Flagelloscypha sp. PMI_526]